MIVKKATSPANDLKTAIQAIAKKEGKISIHACLLALIEKGTGIDISDKALIEHVRTILENKDGKHSKNPIMVVVSITGSQEDPSILDLTNDSDCEALLASGITKEQFIRAYSWEELLQYEGKDAKTVASRDAVYKFLEELVIEETATEATTETATGATTEPDQSQEDVVKELQGIVAKLQSAQEAVTTIALEIEQIKAALGTILSKVE